MRVANKVLVVPENSSEVHAARRPSAQQRVSAKSISHQTNPHRRVFNTPLTAASHEIRKEFHRDPLRPDWGFMFDLLDSLLFPPLTKTLVKQTQRIRVMLQLALGAWPGFVLALWRRPGQDAGPGHPTFRGFQTLAVACHSRRRFIRQSEDQGPTTEPGKGSHQLASCRE